MVVDSNEFSGKLEICSEGDFFLSSRIIVLSRDQTMNR